MTTHGLSIVTFLPLVGALAVFLIPNRKLAKLVALLTAAATLLVATSLVLSYNDAETADTSVVTVLEQREATLKEELVKIEGVTAASIDQVVSGNGALDQLPEEARTGVSQLLEMQAARGAASAPHLRYTEYAPWIASFNINYFMAVDGLSLPLIWLTALLTLLCFVYIYNKDDRPRAFFGLFLLMQTGLIGVFCAMDFFLFYVFWEIVLLPMYFLIGVWGGPRRIYASIKFFIYTLAGSVLMLVAILAMYFVVNGAFGYSTFNILALTELVPQLDQVTTLGTVLSGFDFRWYLFFAMFVGFAIKVPVFPFHTWLPDAHVEAPTSGSMILAGIMLKMGGYGFFRLMYPIAPDVAVSHGVVYFIAGLGMINIVYGALCAMAQNDFKALVAYSSISHMGYVLLGLAAVNGTGFMGGVLQMFNHGVSSAMCFCLVGVIYDRAHHRRLNGFGGMGRVMPFYFGLAIIGFFASLGLPSLNGFVSEVLTFLGAYQPDSLIASGSSVGGMLGLPGIEARWIVYVSLTGIIFTAAYILWTVQRVFFGKVAEEKYLQFKDLNWNEACTLIPLAAMCIIFGVFPSLIIDFMEPSLNAIVESVRTAALAAAGGVG